MASDADYRSLPFREAIDFLRQKLDVPSPKWADILEGAHARAFTVAGATKEGMLGDFRAAIDKALASGTTLADFRKDFDKIVAAYGWDYKGGRGWRTRVIYSTNLTTAYAAGRYQQMTDPDVLRYQPYWRYRHADGVLHPRPAHLAWDGLTLLASDPWWKTHYPPNGWGCHCTVEPVTRRELAASGKSGPDQAPPIELQEKVLDTSAGPVTIATPKGIDPGWGYNVGDAAFGRRLPAEVMEAWRQDRGAAWERLTPGNWQSAGRPERVRADTPKASLMAPARDAAQLEAAIARVIGGAQRALPTADGGTVLIDAAALSQHFPLDRGALVALLPELLTEPYEIWLGFERHRGTGQIALRKRFIKIVDIGKERGIVFVADASAGMLRGWTILRSRDLAYLNAQREGRLLWARSGE